MQNVLSGKTWLLLKKRNALHVFLEIVRSDTEDSEPVKFSNVVFIGSLENIISTNPACIFAGSNSDVQPIYIDSNQKQLR